jgi:SAM-dependent methyltransferase
MNWRIRTVLPLITGYLLDLGCGTNQLVKSYRNGVGVDVYPWKNIDLLVENTSKLPFNDETFDTITIIAALNHISNREEVLCEVYRVLKKEGRLIITMIGPRFSKMWHFMRRPWDVDQKERGMKDGEVFGLTQKGLKQLLLESGFGICYEKPFMLYLNRIYVAKKN